MGFIQEFKEFAIKGNVMDLAVGVVIGAAFGKIVTALVTDIVMPPVGYVLSKGGGNWRELVVGPGGFLHPVEHFQGLEVQSFIVQDPRMIHLFVKLNIYIICIFQNAETGQDFAVEMRFYIG